MMMRELSWKPHQSMLSGERATLDFPNGYTASVLRGGPFYTTDGTYEIAVMHSGDLVYDTPVTDDVCGYLSEQDAELVLRQIKELPERC